MAARPSWATRAGRGRLKNSWARQDARRAWDLSLQAVDLIEQRIATHGIACDWQRGYTYVADSAKKARALREECDDHHLAAVCPAPGPRGRTWRASFGSPRYVAAFHENSAPATCTR